MTPAPDKGGNIKKILLVGNPNVGKSVIFGAITGEYAIVSNYPGTTVEIARSNLRIDGRPYELIDTPGVNSLVPQSEDEKVTRDILLREHPDVIVQVGDAKNLRRTLYLTLQLAEFGVPLVLNLNMIDECRARGIEVDAGAIARLFGVSVNTSIATMGVGVSQLLRLIPQARPPRNPVDGHRELVADVVALLPERLPPTLTAEWLVNADRSDIDTLRALVPGDRIYRLNEILQERARAGHLNLRLCFDADRNRFLDAHLPALRRQDDAARAASLSRRGYRWTTAALGAGLTVHFSNWLLPLAGMPGPSGLLGGWLTERCQPALAAWTASVSPALSGFLFTPPGGEGMLIGEFGLLHPGLTLVLCHLAPVLLPFFLALRRYPRFAMDFDRHARRGWSGLAIVAAVRSVLYVFVGQVGAQILVELLEDVFFGRLLNPAFAWLVGWIPLETVRDLLMGSFGLISMGLTYAIAIVLPVVGAFFLAFGFLEDSGYLPRLAILVNQAFRLMGLNGKAVLPMVLGLGCDTMATMTTRILNSPKERLIATLLLALGIPCSAQLGVMLGIFAGLSPWVAVTVAAVVGLQMLLVGFLAGRLLPGEASDFVLEIPPIRYPVWKNIFLKTRLRVVWFLKEAVPLFLLGTFVLWVLDRLGALAAVIAAARPVVERFLGLPPEIARIFIMGFLRRDYGAAGLFSLVQEGRLSGNQVAVTLIVLTLFVPCIANFFVIIKEQGWKKALAILAFITPVAIATGGAVHFVLRLLHIRL